MSFHILPDRRRIGTNLIFQGYRFMKSGKSKKKIYYRCTNCSAKLSTNIQQNSILSYDENHPHDPDFEFISESYFRIYSESYVLTYYDKIQQSV